MSIVKINAITVPDELGEEVVRRFAARAGAVEGVEGFGGFELLEPADDRNTWLVVTRWDDEDSFQAWVRSAAFAEGHRAALGDEATPRPLELTAELWSFTVAQSVAGSA